MARSIVMAILIWLCALPAFAGSIFLNGTRIDGVTNQKFDNVTVEIDAYGNVHITAKGYAVQGAKSDVNKTGPDSQSQVGPVGEPPTRRYWVVTEKIPSKTQYDIDLFINGKWVAPKKKKYFSTINPSNEKKIAEIAYADKVLDVDEERIIRRSAEMLGIKPSIVLQTKEEFKNQ